jgi:protein SCO1/2
MKRLGVAARLALVSMLLACGPSAPKRHEAKGIVQEVQPDYGQVVIEHEDIPGLMPAMTMNFDVPDRALLARLKRGQRLRFQVEFTGQSYRVVSAEVLGQDEASAASGTSVAGAAAEKEVAPAFRLTDQDGKTVALEDLRGKAVVLDFVYTHCTGPCPVLTGLQRDVQRALTPEQRQKIHFVSITLDPERDTPEVLRAYALARGADLSSWSFLTGAPDLVDAVVKSYGVGVMRRPGVEIEHLVVTFLIDPEGRIVHRLLGLEQPAGERVRLAVETAGG